MSDPSPPVTPEPTIPPEGPPPIPAPEIEPGGPSEDPPRPNPVPIDPGDWRPHDS
jgi:hypothetical protein